MKYIEPTIIVAAILTAFLFGYYKAHQSWIDDCKKSTEFMIEDKKYGCVEFIGGDGE